LAIVLVRRWKDALRREGSDDQDGRLRRQEGLASGKNLTKQDERASLAALKASGSPASV